MGESCVSSLGIGLAASLPADHEEIHVLRAGWLAIESQIVHEMQSTERTLCSAKLKISVASTQLVSENNLWPIGRYVPEPEDGRDLPVSLALHSLSSMDA